MPSFVNDRRWPESAPLHNVRAEERASTLDLGLFGDLERIVDFDAKIPNRTFEFGVSKEELNRA